MKSTSLRLLLVILSLAAGNNLGAEDNPRRIEHVAGGLYRVHMGGNYWSAFLHTPAGIVAIDPVSPEAATWLKSELDQRFGLPVKYLVYSHSDADHSSGGEIFEQAIVVSHEKAKPALESATNTNSLPDITFSNRLSLTLGSQSVNLIYLGKGHGDNLIAIHFPEERAVLSVDNVFVRRLAYGAMGTHPTSPPTDFAEWLNSCEILGKGALIPLIHISSTAS